MTHETDLGIGDPESSPEVDVSDVPDVPLRRGRCVGGGPASEPVVRQPRHFACFDGLRAIVAVSVLLLHTAWVSGFTSRSSLGAYTSRLEIGVSVFFLISGFLLYRPFAVSHLTGRTAPNRRRFWERRLLRIVPAYWLALTVLTYMVHAVSVGAGLAGVRGPLLLPADLLPHPGLRRHHPGMVTVHGDELLRRAPVLRRRHRLPSHSPKNQLVRELIGRVCCTPSASGSGLDLHLPTAHGEGRKVRVHLALPHCATNPPLATLMIDWLPAYLDMFVLGMLLAVTSVWFAEQRQRAGVAPSSAHALGQLDRCRGWPSWPSPTW